MTYYGLSLWLSTRMHGIRLQNMHGRTPPWRHKEKAKHWYYPGWGSFNRVDLHSDKKWRERKEQLTWHNTKAVSQPFFFAWYCSLFIQIMPSFHLLCTVMCLRVCGWVHQVNRVSVCTLSLPQTRQRLCHYLWNTRTGPLNSQKGVEKTPLWGIEHLARHWQFTTLKHKGGFVEARVNWLKWIV